MGMQADPTVIYALQKAGKYDGNIRREDLSFDSPYNTYRYPGLPPGPIAAPGRAALEAALAPADVTYLYFVSRNDGSHVFAATLDEHNANVQKFQVRVLPRAARQTVICCSWPCARPELTRPPQAHSSVHSTYFGAFGSFACVAMSCSIQSCRAGLLDEGLHRARGSCDCSASNSNVGVWPVAISSG